MAERIIQKINDLEDGDSSPSTDKMVTRHHFLTGRHTAQTNTLIKSRTWWVINQLAPILTHRASSPP